VSDDVDPVAGHPGSQDAGSQGGADVSRETVGSLESAPADALARARAAARSRGLRPGVKPKRRFKDVPDGMGGRKSGRDPMLLGQELDAFVSERGWKVDVAVGAVLGRWPTIVGEEVAQHCHPVEFVDTVLTVRADSTAWATNLRLMSATLMGTLAREVGEGTVSQIRVVGPSAPSWSKGMRRVQDGRGPRDTYG
jgi:predicted nucleic acid-binding Zn ribbon protein